MLFYFYYVIEIAPKLCIWMKAWPTVGVLLLCCWPVDSDGFYRAAYDTILFTCAQTLTMASLVYRTAEKQKIKEKLKKQLAQKKRCGQTSVKAVRKEEVKLRG